MSEKRTRKKGLRTNAKRQKLLKGISEGLNVSEAGRVAGYGTYQSAHRALNSIRIHTPDLLDRIGLPAEKLLRDLFLKNWQPKRRSFSRTPVLSSKLERWMHMTFNFERESNLPRCTDSIHYETDMTTMEMGLGLPELQSMWRSLDRNERREFLQQPENRLAGAVLDSLWWMQNWTKTRDDQDQRNPYKHFPRAPYFKVLHDDWQRESILYIEKSRSMLTSWWAAAETLHFVMTHQPAKALFIAQDQDALVLRDYVWTLYEQQEVVLWSYATCSQSHGRESCNPTTRWS
jgi:hypothetical protein